MGKQQILHCEFCFKTFTRPSALRPHRYTHTGEKPFACHIPGCDKRFTVKSNLRRHHKVHERRQFKPVYSTFEKLSSFILGYLYQREQQQHSLADTATTVTSYLPTFDGSNGVVENKVQTTNSTATMSHRPSPPPQIVLSAPSPISKSMGSSTHPFMNNNVPSLSYNFSPAPSSSTSNISAPLNLANANHTISHQQPQQCSKTHPTYSSYHHHHQQGRQFSFTSFPSTTATPLLSDAPPPVEALKEQHYYQQQQQVEVINPLTTAIMCNISNIGSSSSSFPNSTPSSLTENNGTNNISTTLASTLSFQYSPQYHHNNNNNNKAADHNIISGKAVQHNNDEELVARLLTQPQQQQPDALQYPEDPKTNTHPIFYYLH